MEEPYRPVAAMGQIGARFDDLTCRARRGLGGVRQEGANDSQSLDRFRRGVRRQTVSATFEAGGKSAELRSCETDVEVCDKGQDTGNERCETQIIWSSLENGEAGNRTGPRLELESLQQHLC